MSYSDAVPTPGAHRQTVRAVVVAGIEPESRQAKSTRLAAVRARRDATLQAIRATGMCEWYAMCTNPAVALVSHPILADVPTCQRCLDKHDLHDRIVGQVTR